MGDIASRREYFVASDGHSSLNFDFHYVHTLTSICINNFRSCKEVSIPLCDFTPVVGYNNAGKSNILAAIEWLIEPGPLAPADFFDASLPVIISGAIKGISATLVEKMPANHQAQVGPYLSSETLEFRRVMSKPGNAASVKTELRKPTAIGETAIHSWVTNPSGIPQALKALFPESIRVYAMQDAADDVAKNAKGNTLGKLIGDVIDPLRKEHEGELKAALKGISNKFCADGGARVEQLKEFDQGASASLAELFPGLQLTLDVPLPEILDLFKNGTVRVVESHGSTTSSRPFAAVGHGAQRCIQMALIRYLADKGAKGDSGKRKMLLIDEPELYLHPQAVEQVRRALKILSCGQYQVIFSTHSPMMVHRDDAPHTVMVRKLDHHVGTIVRVPLAAAVKSSVQEGGHAARVIFELGNAAQIFFSDRVLLMEGKTEQALLPLLYEACFKRAPRADKTGLVALQGSGNFHNALAALKAMEINGRIIADLDYVFKNANNISGYKTPPDEQEVKAILARLQSVHKFPLDGGMPSKGKDWSAAKTWRLFAEDEQGKKIASEQHSKLKSHGVWIWKEGTIEDVLKMGEKGEEAIQEMERDIPKLNDSAIAEKYPAMNEFLQWLAN